MNSIKYLILIAMVMAALLIGLFIGTQKISDRIFSKLEQEETAKDVERTQNALSAELRQLAQTTDDYAGWDDAYTFVQNGNKAFIKSNLDTVLYEKLRLNLLIYLNRSGEIVYGRSYDYHTKRVMDVSPSVMAHIQPGKLLLGHSSPESEISGLLQLPEGLMLVSSHPVLTSAYKGPLMGTFVIGRFLDAQEIARLCEQTKLAISIHTGAQITGSSALQTLRQKIADSAGVYIQPLNEEHITGASLLKDIYGKDSGILQIVQPRRIHQSNKKELVHYYQLYFAITALSIALFALLVHKLILARRLELQQEEKLRQSKEMLSLFMKHSPIYSFIHEVTPTESRILKASDNFIQMLGISETELVGKTVAELFPPDLAAKITDDNWAIVSNGEAVTLEETLNDRHYTTVKFPIVQGGKTLLAGYIIDITEHKQTIALLSASEERYRALFARASEGIVYVTVDGKIVEVNESFALLHGYSADEMRSMSLQEIDTPENSRLVPERLKRILSGEILTFEVEHYHKDGHAFPLEVSASLISFGGLSYVQSFHRDITERKQMEKEKDKLKEQLLQSQKMEAIGQLTGGIAHDFNNLLTVILGYCNLLRMNPLNSDEETESLLHINSAAEKAVQLIKSLLTFSRKQVINPVPVNLNDIVPRVHKFLSRIIGADISLKATYSDSPLWTVADPGQIEQVLMNMATNARDAMPDGGVLTIETCAQEIDDSLANQYGVSSSDRYAVISVTDTGTGMDEETRNRIFEPFFTTKDVGKGTGLGMSIVHGIVAQHNGFITIDSAQNAGTTFRIFLPLISEEELPQQDDPHLESVRGGNEVILVVEDDAAVRTLLESVLKLYGYKVILAVNGADGIEQFTAHRSTIDLVIMDLKMPEINGMDAAKTMKRLQEKIRILYISGYPADFSHSMAGADFNESLIEKPLKSKELLIKIREMLDYVT